MLTNIALLLRRYYMPITLRLHEKVAINEEENTGWAERERAYADKRAREKKHGATKRNKKKRDGAEK